VTLSVAYATCYASGVNVSGKRVLIFGDSMSHHGLDSAPDAVDVTDASTTRSASPGDLLASHLLNAGAASVRINAKVGRSAYSFFNAEQGDAILAQEIARKPDIVFVILGTNDMLRDQQLDAAAMTKIRRAFADAGADVWCVGPPSFSDSLQTTSGMTYNDAAQATVTMERQVFGTDRFIDARGMTTDILTSDQGRAKDLLHFTPSGAQKWAARLAYFILAVPETATPRRWPQIALAGVTLAAAAMLVGYIASR
jgi:lysophospholipase L1-like esterase